MPDSRISYGWIVVGAAMVIVSMGLGAMFALAVFITPIEETMRWSRSGISAIALINWLAMGVGSFLWGTLSDRVGTRIVVLVGGSLLGLGLVLSSQVDALWQLSLTFGVAVGLGAGAFYALKSLVLNMSVLVSLGILTSYLFSLGLTLLAPRQETFYEAAVMLAVFLLFGHWMEMKARRGSSDSVRKLLDLAPQRATVERNGRQEEIAAAEVLVGDVVVLKPGDKVAVDGECWTVTRPWMKAWSRARAWPSKTHPPAAREDSHPNDSTSSSSRSCFVTSAAWT